jgi:hypothetical protein
MKTFKRYLLESNQSELTHVMSGPLNDMMGDDSSEHAYHASMPSTSGSTNLWISHVERPLGSQNLEEPHHELHFSISDTLTPDAFHRQRMELENKGDRRSKEPCQICYSIPGERENQYSTSFRGPSTMFHVLRHMQSIIEKIPSGHKILINAASDDPKDTEKKATAYRAMAGRLERTGLVKTQMNKDGSSFIMHRI